MTTGIGPPGPQLPAHFQPAEAGQHEVQHYKVRRLLFHPAQGRQPVMHAFHPMAITDQVPADDISKRPIVVHDHDPAGRIEVAQHPGRRQSAAIRGGRLQVTADTVAGSERPGLPATICHWFVRILAGRPRPRCTPGKGCPAAAIEP
jgi:hypothetical protein